MSDLQAELESLKRENARLHKLLKLTDAEAAPTHGTQAAWSDKAPGPVDARSGSEASVGPRTHGDLSRSIGKPIGYSTRSEAVDRCSQLGSLASSQAPLGRRPVERLAQLCRIRPGGKAVTDGSGDRRHRKVVLLRHVTCRQAAAVESVELSAGAQLLFRFVAAAYERRSLGVASHWPFESWGRFLPEHTTAVSMLDRIVHHADVLTLKGASYRLRGRGIDSLPSIRTTTDQGES